MVGLQFHFQGSIRHCPAAMTYGIKFSASTSFFAPLLAVLNLPFETSAEYKYSSISSMCGQSLDQLQLT